MRMAEEMQTLWGGGLVLALHMGKERGAGGWKGDVQSTEEEDS